MFKQIIDAIKSVFASLFGSKKTQDTTERPKPTPQTTLNEPNIPQDASEVRSDSVIVVANEMELIVIPPNDTSEEFEKDVFDDTKKPATVPPVKPTVTPTTSTTPTTTPKPITPVPTTETKTKQRYLWCLDNGHGSKTPGKRSPQLDDSGKRFMEYEFNRDIVKRITTQLDEAEIKYFITVPEVDIDDFLQGRVERANNKKSAIPKLFVSVHSNAGPAANINTYAPDSVSGIETWFFTGSKRGQKLAGIFQKHLIEATGFKNRHVKSKVEGQFYVLRKTNMTSVLTENGFYNNRKEVAELMKEEIRQQIADAHVKAILEVEKEGL